MRPISNPAPNASEPAPAEESRSNRFGPAVSTPLLAAPWIVSAAFHVGVLVLLVSLVHQLVSTPPAAGIVSTIGSADQPPEGFDSLLVEPPPGGENPDSDELGLGMTDVADVLRTATDEMLSENPITLAGGGAAGEGGGPGGDGQGPGGGPGKATFFGTESVGERFVFLIDCSTSMEGEKFARARHELIKAIQLLSETQEFYVIFFSDRTFPMFDPRPIRVPVQATKLQKSKVRRWISNRKVVGGTLPDEGLQMALDLEPDVVYFLSDGAFPGSARKVAVSSNKSGAAIHTIAFGHGADEALLKAIAEDNKGRYRFVP